MLESNPMTELRTVFYLIFGAAAILAVVVPTIYFGWMAIASIVETHREERENARRSRT